MEGWSVEDDGEGVCFNVYCYNVQPGIKIDYATGENWSGKSEPSNDTEDHEYILNTSTHRFHLPDCASVAEMSEENREEYVGSREDLIASGCSPCGRCTP